MCLRLVNEDIQNIGAGTVPSGQRKRLSVLSSFNTGIRHSLERGEYEEKKKEQV